MQFLKKIHEYIPGFRHLSPRSMAIALTYYAVAAAALFSRWYWGLILLALPFLLFNVIDLNKARGKLAPLLAACAAGLVVLCGTAGVLSAGGPPAQPVAERTAALAAAAKPSPKPSAPAASVSGAPTQAGSASAALTSAAPNTPATAGSGPASPAATASPEAAPVEQVQYAYVASKNSKSFHRPDCASAKRIKPENLIGFRNREEAVAAGLIPCKKCNP